MWQIDEIDRKLVKKVCRDRIDWTFWSKMHVGQYNNQWPEVVTRRQVLCVCVCDCACIALPMYALPLPLTDTLYWRTLPKRPKHHCGDNNQTNATKRRHIGERGTHARVHYNLPIVYVGSHMPLL